MPNYQSQLAPLLPMEFFRQIIGWDPWRFWGWSDQNHLITATACTPVIQEYDWQGHDAPGRQDIAEAIVTAETRLFDYLRYEVAPRYKYDTLPWPRLADRRMIRVGAYDADMRWLNVDLREGFLQGIGAELLTPIQLGAPIVFSDPDGDGLPELATIGPIATTVTDISQIALYVPAAYRLGLDASTSEQYRIQPSIATISGGFVTIRAYGYTFMLPSLKEGYATTVVDPAVPTNFMTTVDVYQRSLATGASAVAVDVSQGVVYWETRPYHGWWCQCGSCGTSPTFNGSVYDPGAVAQAAARVGIRNARTGNVIPAEAVYNTTDGTWAALNWSMCEDPDRVLIRYLAGQPLGVDGFMDRKWRNIVTRFAAAELKRQIVGCEAANRALEYWQQDMSKIGNASTDLFNVSARVTDNPFGTRRGHVYAWSQVMDLPLETGAVVM